MSYDLQRLHYYAEDLNILGRTKLTLRNVDTTFYDTILLHAYQLEVTKVVVETEQGDQFPNKFEYINSLEVLEIKFFGSLKQVEILTVFIDYKFHIDLNRKYGVYVPFGGSYGKPYELATFFEPWFARMAFPTFDDPHFRFRFSMNISIFQDPQKKLDTVLFNAELSSNKNTRDERSFGFGETKPIPAYLVAFAVLNREVSSIHYEFEHLNIPIRFYGDNSNGFFRETKLLKYAKHVIKFTMSYCKSRFETPWKLTDKLDILFVDHYAWGMEQPGLITGALFAIIHNSAI
ncbi:uncharacterized protein LOC142356144 [Convolutriloba macropyga]|uniref:uncharacterized protein LOC142356144 n=1 Tax=Convolutriloba macropyga TaxID=536237 RepID=UPI003F5281D3